MSLTYTWKLTALKKTTSGNLSNVIVGTRWECTGADEDGDSGVFAGATPFNLADVDPNNFISYETLTESQVLSWIQAVVVGQYKDHIDSVIQRQIDQKKNPVEEVSSGNLPWDPTPTEPEPTV